MNQILNDAKNRMQTTCERLNSEYASIQAGRATASVLDKVTVDYYGTPTPINQVAAVSVSEARVLIIQPWDISILNAVEKAIQKSDIGINPQNDGKVIRLIFPQLTEERRKEISKEVSSMSEESKIAIRNIRRDGNDDLKKQQKDGTVTEDGLKTETDKLQKLTDKFIDEINKIYEAKEKDILQN